MNSRGEKNKYNHNQIFIIAPDEILTACSRVRNCLPSGGEWTARRPRGPGAWGVASPQAPRSPGSARQAVRSARNEAEPAGDADCSRSSANPDGAITYRGRRYDCGMCAREFHGVKNRVKHSNEGHCRLAVARSAPAAGSGSDSGVASPSSAHTEVGGT